MSSVWSHQSLLPAREPCTCPCCGEAFDSGEEKLKHQNAVGHFRCAICHRQFLDTLSVIQHQLRVRVVVKQDLVQNTDI